MKVAIVNCFETYNIRAFQVEQYFMDIGYTVDVFLSDFSHRDKERVLQQSKYNYVSVPTYKKNLSLKRLYSHFIFSKKIKNILEHNQYDIIYALIPPNSLTKQVSLISESEIYFDVIDLWPEAMPVKALGGFPGIKLWQKLRDDYLQKCEVVITECKLFENILKEKHNDLNYKNIYFYGGEMQDINYSIKPKNKVRFCYIGSINNLLDIDFLRVFLSNIKEMNSIEFNIIGDGEKKIDLIHVLRSLNIDYHDYGVIFDDERKKQIIKNSDFGINFMKTTTMVGMTMKSIEYFRFGLPVVNNIPFDTWEMVERYDVGININNNNFRNEVEKIILINAEKLADYRKNIKRMYEENFSEISFKKNMDSIFKGRL